MLATGAGTKAGRARPGREALATWLAAAVALLVVLAAFKFLPGQIPNAQSMLGDAAYAECLRHTREAGGTGCANFGHPLGSPKPFGLPASIVADRLAGGDGTVTPGEVRTVYAGFLAFAFLLACALFRRLGGNWPLGILGAVLYLLAPIVQGQGEYGALQLGLALVPGYLLLDVLLLDALCERKRGRAAGLLALVLAVRVFALFLDGYSFLFSAALTTCFLAVSALVRDRRGPALIALAVHVACSALAAWVYRQYMPSDALAVMPIDFFRGAGVDLLTLVAPLQWQGLYGALGLGLDVDSDMAWGGRPALVGMFAGYSFLLALGVLAWATGTRRMPRPDPLAAGILLAGACALLLSLGPSLKFGDFRDGGADALAFDSYLMPASEATLALPTGWIYTQVPGIRNARVLSRWQVLVRLALVAGVVLVVAWLWRRDRRLPAVLLAAVAVLEVAPDPRALAGEARRAAARTSLVHGDYAAGLAEGVRPGEVVLLLQLHDAASGNEYAANILCARARARCYNAGGDKASVVVQAAWPERIRALKDGSGDRASLLQEAFASGEVDVVAVPHFDLRLVVYPRQENRVDRATVVARAEEIAGGSAAGIHQGRAYSFIRPTAHAR